MEMYSLEDENKELREEIERMKGSVNFVMGSKRGNDKETTLKLADCEIENESLKKQIADRDNQIKKMITTIENLKYKANVYIGEKDSNLEELTMREVQIRRMIRKVKQLEE